MPDVFLSYSRKDGGFVARLCQALKDLGKSVWRDKDDIPAAAPWRAEIAAGIEASNAVVFIISPNSAVSEECRKECSYALEHNKRLVPLVHVDSPREALLAAVGELNWIFCRETDDFALCLQSLIKALDTDLSWVRAHTRLLVRAGEWEKTGRNDSFLLRGADLEEAEGWLKSAGQSKERNPTPLQTEYIISGRKAAIRRQRQLLGAVSFGLIVAIFLAALAWFQRKQAVYEAKVAASRELASNSGHVSDEQLRMLLAVEAVERMPTVEAQEALRASLPALPIPLSAGHTEPIGALTFSPDGAKLATGSERMVKVWNALTGDELISLPTATNSSGTFLKVISLAFSGNSLRLAGANRESVTVWDLPSRHQLLSVGLHHGGEVQSFALSADGKRLGFSGPSEARLLEVKSGKVLWDWTSPDDAPGVHPMFSQNGQWLAIASNTTVHLWNTAPLREILVSSDRPDAIQSILFSPDSERFAALGESIMEVWEVASKTKLRSVPRKAGDVQFAAFSPDGRSLADLTGNLTNHYGHSVRSGQTYYGPQTIVVWESTLGRQLAVLPTQSNNITYLAFHPKTNWVVTASETGVQMWDTATGHLLRTLDGRRVFAFSMDGMRMASPDDGNGATVWDAVSGEVRFTLDGQDKNELRAVAFSPDRQRIATASAKGRVRVWSTSSGKSQFDVRSGQSGFPDAIAFSRDGTRIVMAGTDGLVTVLDALSGRALMNLSNHHQRILCLAFSPDGKKLAAGVYHGSVQMWDTTVASEPYIFAGMDSVFGVAFSPNGDRLAGIGLGAGKVWDVSSGQKAVELSAVQQRHGGAVFSPDGKQIATESQVWDANSGEELFKERKGQWSIHADSRTDLALVGIVRVTFSSDGRLLATGKSQGVTVWDGSSGAETMTLPCPSGKVCGLAFTPDAKHLLIVSDDWHVFAHPVNLESLMALAKTRITRGLSRDEEEKYLHRMGARGLDTARARSLK